MSQRIYIVIIYLVCRLDSPTRLIQTMSDPTTNNTPAEEEVKQETPTSQAFAEGEERKIGLDGEENKGEGKSW